MSTLRAVVHRMAPWKSRGNEFILLFAFTFGTLAHCRFLSLSSGHQATKDVVDKVLPDIPGQEEGYDQFNLDFLSDDPVSHLQKSGLIKGKVVSSSEEAWDAISTKLRCGDDFMKLQLLGSGVDQVELCRGNSAPVPLDHLPPNCGQTTTTYGGLVYNTPYDGCGVSQQDGSYVMQMLWQGNPAVISCPMTSSAGLPSSFLPGSPFQLPSDIPDGASTTTQQLRHPFYPLQQSHFYYPHYHHHGWPKHVPTSAPTTAAVQDSIQKPQLPGYPNKFWPHFNPYHHHGWPKQVPTSAPTTTKAVQDPIQKPQLPGYPNTFWPHFNPYHHHGWPKHVPTSAPTTTKAVQDPIQKPQLPGYPNMFWPHFNPYHHHGWPKHVPTSAPTTTKAVQDPIQKPQLPGYPNMFWPHFNPYHHHGWPKHVPTSAPTTTKAVQDPIQKPQLPGYPNMFWPHFNPYHHHGWPKHVPTSAPTTTKAVQDPIQKPQLPGYPNMFWPHFNHYHHHGWPKRVPTSAPTTTKAVQDPFQKPHLPGYPNKFWPYYYQHQYPVKPQSPTITPQPCTTTPSAAHCSPSANQQPVNPPKYSSVVYGKYPFAHQFFGI